MRRQLEGSRAIAEAVARCRPQVVPAYPITPQTHIVEAIGAMVRDGSLPGCEFLTVESEFAAMSAAIGPPPPALVRTRRRQAKDCST
jgi:pyruvate ferredoxin oxidoreductase alpha subunit